MRTVCSMQAPTKDCGCLNILFRVLNAAVNKKLQVEVAMASFYACYQGLQIRLFDVTTVYWSIKCATEGNKTLLTMRYLQSHLSRFHRARWSLVLITNFNQVPESQWIAEILLNWNYKARNGHSSPTTRHTKRCIVHDSPYMPKNMTLFWTQCSTQYDKEGGHWGVKNDRPTISNCCDCITSGLIWCAWRALIVPLRHFEYSILFLFLFCFFFCFFVNKQLTIWLGKFSIGVYIMSTPSENKNSTIARDFLKVKVLNYLVCF